MNVPRATLRLQFHRGFTFADAEPLVGYFASLGISHIYASPIMTARPGSPHGYDTVDPTRINPELGGAEEFRRLVHTLRGHGIGIIIDIVPNHMAVGKDNPWWMDVLAAGRACRYAKFFDIDWEPANLHLRGKVLLPILGRPYGEALADGDIKIRSDETGAFVTYFDHLLPLASAAAHAVRRASPDAFDPSNTSSRERLHMILEQQYYRLAWWRTANDEINWRRFFDINELAALRMEVDEVFETFHAEIFRLYREGLIDGVRVDHVDGLAQPGPYCRKLRARLRELEVTRPAEAPQGSAYLIIEKILSRGERLRTTWETDGTTGYDFMDEVNAVQHDAAGEPVLTALWTRISGRYANFDAEEELARRQILDRSFSAQRKSVVRALYVVAQRGLETRDIPWAAIHRALTEILVHFPVYRIYARVDQAAETDRAFLGHAVARAKRSCLPGDVWLIERLALWLSGTPITAGDDPLQNLALVRFAQLSTSLCAKAVEDTAFYRYGRLISRNDVGFDVRRFSSTKADFHEAMMRRAMDFPHAMLATATHDHKRGEDVRARLAILSERASDWAAAIDRWIAAIAPHCIVTDGTVMPSHSDLTILFQTLVGAWPMTLSVADSGGLDAYAKRIAAWQQKALREAKLHSDWTAPNEAYERAAADVVARLFSDRRDVLSEIEAFARGIMAAGAVNSLAQTLVKITAPGVPDIYQGTEFWDFSLVDPDNRTPVNFEARQKSLPLARAERLLPAWRDGRIKQFVIASALAVRKDLAPTFFEGTYVPLEIAGPMAEHVLGFARVWRSVRAIIAVPRCIAHMISDDEALAIDGGIWGDSRLKIPGNLQASYCDAFASGERQRVAADIPIERLFARLPVAFLTTRSD